MALYPDYCTASELKAYLRISDTADDTQIALAITAASRAIDQHVGRQFGSASATRSYSWDGRCIDGRSALAVDDVTAVTTVTVLDSAGSTVDTLTTSDFDLWPWNAAADGMSYTHVVLRPTASATFSSEARGNSVAATFGWSAVPDTVKQATLIQASRVFARRNSPYGIAGSPELGNELRLLAKVDADVAVLLSRYSRPWGAV